MVGSYEGSPRKYTTPLDGLVAVVSTVYQQGCDIACATTQVDKAKKVVAAADAVVLVMGSYQTIERESHDRVNLTLSGTRKEKSKWVGGGKV
ncbi:Beta-D-xylosidase 4 [Capsicum baccatum]|uniref:Beta-D-xylosidase 4 n=1 Tax=Capsicum baccatum TaxID=33114 RepID=A0A2G2VMN8_CAPBA|nr:Beta-D-xylosidase 4 [Capsicum baccatum]